MNSLSFLFTTSVGSRVNLEKVLGVGQKFVILYSSYCSWLEVLYEPQAPRILNTELN